MFMKIIEPKQFVDAFIKAHSKNIIVKWFQTTPFKKGLFILIFSFQQTLFS